MNMIAMIVGGYDGFEFCDFGGEELLAKIRTAIDQDAVTSAFDQYR